MRVHHAPKRSVEDVSEPSRLYSPVIDESSVTDRCAQMAGYLRTLRGWASEEDNIRIGELLDAVDEDTPEMPMGEQPASVADTDGDDSRAASRISRFDDSIVESDEQVDINSLDLLDENLHENDRSRATGFVGKNSEVQWLRSLLHFEKAEDDPSKVTGATAKRKISTVTSGYNEQVSVVTFYLDSEDVDSDFYVDPYELPTPEAAERLLAIYMDKVHGSFPILPKRLFEDQFHKYFLGLKNGTAPRLNAKWQAILNLIFAIGARYSHLIKAEWRGNEKDHLVYQARARSFAWNETTLVQHPDLPQIQVAGMLAFYYLSVGQVSRAWIVAGTALRFSQALGLHVRNEDPSASPPKREVLVRIWWSLYYLERQLSVITGRPSVIVDSSCSVPLPLPVPESHISEDAPSRRASTVSVYTDPPSTPTGLRRPDANSGSYIKAVVQMGIITQSVLTGLYSAGTMIRSPVEIQQDIIQLGQRLDNWAATLPNEFNPLVRFAKGKFGKEFFRERMLLGFQFYSGRILLTRPCLGGLGQAGKDRGDTTNAGFLRQMAMICLEAAKSQLDLLPDDPDPLFLLENGPWWSIVHHFMQALAVILLALSYSSLGHQEHNVLSGYAKKSIRWLRSLDDPLADRASKVAFNSFELVANRLSLDISDLWSEYTPVFPGMASGEIHDGIGTAPYPIPSSSGIFNPSANMFDPALGMPIPSAPHPLFHLDGTEDSPTYGSAHGGPEYDSFNPYRPSN
ncbi:hypothetical protein DM02DRAFT_70300 [Periconia macrospinosa]|uniref:Xylanolytic transcriptional activator regulatory domain-containing protein n=1 Tax=Periconia macrospinosa TaxID=97972 RepID=A0A2V1E550_9PLEO|nr:hypothetical protein DM02DRAFT_70300 [Periconia macrospinosa]